MRVVVPWCGQDILVWSHGEDRTSWGGPNVWTGHPGVRGWSHGVDRTSWCGPMVWTGHPGVVPMCGQDILDLGCHSGIIVIFVY